EVSYVADNDLWLRMALAAPFRRIPGTWSRYRIHETQRDTQRQRIVREWDQAVRELWPNLSWSLRRSAKVGCHLTAHRYSAPGAWWERSCHLYAAVASDPSCLLWREFPRVELLQPLRQALSRCKRALLRLPPVSHPAN